MKTGLRWLAVLPVAILGGMLACFPLHWLIMLACRNDPDSTLMVGDVSFLYYHRDSIERFLLPLAASMAFVLSGARTAPKEHFKTASALLCVYYLIGGFIIYAVTNKIYDTAVIISYWGIALAFVGPLLALWIVREKSAEWAKA